MLATWRSTGFSMIELIVVMIITGILAVVLLPRLADQPVTLSAQAEQIASDIRYVQTLGMTQGDNAQRQRIVISAGSYSLADNSGTAIVHPATGNTSAIQLSGITVTTTPALPASPNNFIAFDGKGRPYNFSGILAADQLITLTATGGTASGRVNVSFETGRVTVSVP
jgi:prepilin-type N-terminal cleavage/methylation domain-containing protein